MRNKVALSIASIVISATAAFQASAQQDLDWTLVPSESPSADLLVTFLNAGVEPHEANRLALLLLEGYDIDELGGCDLHCDYYILETWWCDANNNRMHTISPWRNPLIAPQPNFHEEPLRKARQGRFLTAA